MLNNTSVLPDLWTKAVESLNEDDQLRFNFSQDDKRAALESLLQTVDVQKDDNVKAQLVIRRINGKPIVLREIFAKIVTYITKFKEVGDVIVQYDPGHAALPWAAVRVILQAAASEQHIYSSMMGGLEHVSDVIARYAWIETSYLHASSKMRNQLQDAIEKLYVVVLQFLAKARHYYSKSTYQRVLKSLFQFDDQAVQKYLKAMSDEEEKVNSIARLIDAQYLREISKTMEGGFSSLLDRVGGVSKQIEDLRVDLSRQAPPADAQRDKLLQWIDATSTYETFVTAKNARQSGTCDWILERKEFTDWLDSDRSSKVLWLHGKHGTGKTILSARITECLMKECPAHFAYFFCFYGSEKKRKCGNIIRAWIHQIVKQDDEACSAALTIYKDRESHSANNFELWQCFRHLIAQPVPYYFLVDGFDECEKDDDSLPNHSLLDAKTKFLKDLNDAVDGTQARILIVSRPDPEVRDQMQANVEDASGKKSVWTDYEITLEDTSDDIIQFAQSIMNLRIPNRDIEFREELAADAAGKAEGMFLWIKLLHKRLSRSKSPPRLRKIIRDTPSGLDQAYERDLLYILSLDAEERDRAVAILRWTLFAFEPLTIRQLSEALLVEFEDEASSDDEISIKREYSGVSQACSDGSDTDDQSEDSTDGHYLPLSEVPDFETDETAVYYLLKTCGSLIELRGGEDGPKSDQIVRFVHFSVQEYLLSTSDVKLPQMNKLQLSDRAFCHERLARTCLQYLVYDDFLQHVNSTLEEFDKKDRKYALLGYAGKCWGLHTKRCWPLPQSIITLCNQLLDPQNAKWLSYSEVVGGRANGSYERFISRFRESYPSPLFYASLWGIVRTMQFLINDRNEDVNHVGGLYGNPLGAAAAHGYEDAVLLLLQQGADINLSAGQFGTPISGAAACGSLKTVELLLLNGSDVNLKGGWWDEPPLIAASRYDNRKTAEAIVELLLDAGADLEAADSKGETVVHKFAASGATNVLKLLVARHANVNRRDSDGETPLHLAIIEARQSASLFLIRNGADLTITDNFKDTALHIAAETDQTASISELLDHGADINAQSSHGDTPLLFASRESNLAAVELLLERGANPRINNSKGLSALRFAVILKHPSLVKCLLVHGAQASAADAKGRTPLHYIFNLEQFAGRSLILNLLDPAMFEDRSAVYNAINSSANSFDREWASIFRLLLEHGADLEAKDVDGRTPLDLVLSYREEGARAMSHDERDHEQGNFKDEQHNNTIDVMDNT